MSVLEEYTFRTLGSENRPLGPQERGYSQRGHKFHTFCKIYTSRSPRPACPEAEGGPGAPLAAAARAPLAEAAARALPPLYVIVWVASVLVRSYSSDTASFVLCFSPCQGSS